MVDIEQLILQISEASWDGVEEQLNELDELSQAVLVIAFHEFRLGYQGTAHWLAWYLSGNPLVKMMYSHSAHHIKVVRPSRPTMEEHIQQIAEDLGAVQPLTPSLETEGLGVGQSLTWALKAKLANLSCCWITRIALGKLIHLDHPRARMLYLQYGQQLDLDQVGQEDPGWPVFFSDPVKFCAAVRNGYSLNEILSCIPPGGNLVHKLQENYAVSSADGGGLIMEEEAVEWMVDNKIGADVCDGICSILPLRICDMHPSILRLLQCYQSDRKWIHGLLRDPANYPITYQTGAFYETNLSMVYALHYGTLVQVDEQQWVCFIPELFDRLEELDLVLEEKECRLTDGLFPRMGWPDDPVFVLWPFDINDREHVITAYPLGEASLPIVQKRSKRPKSAMSCV